MSPGDNLERPTGEANGDLWIRAKAYSLSLGADPLFIRLTDRGGHHWADLFLGASVDTRHQADATGYISAPVVSEIRGGWRLTFALESSAWSSKRLLIDCFDEWFQVGVEVEGSGDITDCRLLAGDCTGDGRRGPGIYRSAAHFLSVFNPEPSSLERRSLQRGVSTSVDVVGSDVAGMRHWFFTPAPFCFGASLEAPPGDELPDGPWLTMGLAVQPGQHDFTRFGLEAVDDGFGFGLDYEGHHQVDGRWRSPQVAFIFGTEDPYEGIARYVQLLESRALVPPALDRIRPSWWSKPIFCGWGAQCHLARMAGQPAQRFATQTNYDDFLSHLAARGLRPGTIVIDDKWQAAYGTGEVDTDKWPDLSSWIATRHAAGQRVLLWWKAWDSEGLDADLCMLDAFGRPLVADPSNPAYEDRLRETVRRLLSEDSLDADGFKIDFTARTPSGPTLRQHGRGWGAELLHQLLTVIYSEAKRTKPDALIITHTPNPYFRTVADMIRLNDVNTAHPVVPQMMHRARVVQAACPDLLIDPDNWQMPDRASWRDYLSVQPSIGIPSLYYASHVDLTSESFEEGDYAAIADAWGTARTT